jgi:hypothetical protein
MLGSNIIPVVTDVKDLGVVIDAAVTFKKHINNIVARSSSRVALIYKCFISKDVVTLLRAYKTYVRPILDYASCVWSPYHITAIKQIESVQRKFTKRLPGYANLEYCQRCAQLNIETLELRRLRQDLLLTYKILFGMVNVCSTEFFTLSNTGHNTRGHCYKLSQQHCRINIRSNFYCERVIKPWNSMNAQQSDFNCFASFKNLVMRADFSNFLVIV